MLQNTNKRKNPVDHLGGIHGEPENDGFHKQDLDYLRFQVYRAINLAKINLSTSDIACVADETKPRYSPSANQRPIACSAPRVLPVLSIIGSNWLLHMAVLSCTVIGRVDVVEPYLRSR